MVQKAMNNPRAFLEALNALHLNTLDSGLAQAIVDFSVTEGCDPDIIKKKSCAMSGAASFLRAVAAYFCPDIEFPVPERGTPSPQRKRGYLDHTENSQRRIK